MKNRYYITIIIAFLALVSCQKEELYTGPCNVRFKAYVQDEVSVTRGYTTIGNSTDAFAAELFISNGATVNSSTLQWDGTEVTTYLKLEEGTYSFYGYSPQRQNATFDTRTQIMSVPGIIGLGTEDVMLIKKASLNTEGKNEATVPLQMDHLMAKVTPYFYVNSAYANLRTIKIKKVQFSMSDAATYTAQVTYNSDDSYTTNWINDNNPATVTLTSFDKASQPLVLDQNADAKGEALSTEYFYLCPNQSTAKLKMSVTYDVYDKTGTVTRENVTADNAILKFKNRSLVAGTNYKLYIKVVPTYLYVLSDNDEPVLIIP